jgi:hypothetical protein
MKITKSQLEAVCQQSIKNVQGLLKSVNQLLTKKITRIYALGLYMYAVEEYGKACLLKEYLEKEKEANSYSIPDWIFGGRGAERNTHNKKIGKGFERLPEECKILSVSPPLEIKVNTSTKTQTFALENGHKVSVPAGSTGLFEDKRYIEFDYKTRCFYVDSDPIDNEERNNMSPDKKGMKKNVKLVKEVTKKF